MTLIMWSWPEYKVKKNLVRDIFNNELTGRPYKNDGMEWWWYAICMWNIPVPIYNTEKKVFSILQFILCLNILKNNIAVHNLVNKF